MSDIYKLGMFYTNPDDYGGAGFTGASDKRVPATKDSISMYPGQESMWGFRFMFNPTVWNYSISSSNEIDWTLGNQNNSILVAPGIGQSMSVNILLDRVADMAVMKRWAKTGILPGQGQYPRQLTVAECAGILHRGTEYDLEFLYRVVNGQRYKSAMMGDASNGLELETADVGYLTSLPFIFEISAHRKYTVVLQSLSVSHDIFNRDMVPIRSYVSLGLQRLPDLYSDATSQLNTEKTRTFTSLIDLPAKGTQGKVPYK